MKTTRNYALWAVAVTVLVCLTGCKDELIGPTPSIANPSAGSALPVDPGIICRTQHTARGSEMALTGANFSPIPFAIPKDPKVALPSVTLSRATAVDGSAADAATVFYDGEPGAANSNLLSWESDGSMTFRVTDGLSMQEGIYDVTVTNANDESATSAASLAVVDRPTPTSVAPGLVCLAEADRALTISGSSFLRNGNQRPVVTFGDADAVEVDGLEDCATVAHAGIDAEICDTLEVTVPQNYLEPGTHAIVIRNPETAACESVHDEDSVELVVVGPPVIESAEPPTVCSETTGLIEVTFTGSNFINADGESFEVQINGAVVTPSAVGGCEPIDVDGFDAESCTSFTVSIDAGATPQGGVTVSVTNPTSVGCGYTTDMLFSIVGPPTVTSVAPPVICSDSAQTFTITGENFAPGATVLVGAQQADDVDVQDSTTIVATFSTGVPAGTYDVTVDNGVGCTGTLTNGIEVDPAPLVFFVDPPVIYNGVAFEITIFTSGLEVDAAAVELVDSGGTATMLTGFQSPQRPNRILATIPAGLAPGDYEVQVTSQNGCPSAFNGSLTITDSLTLNLTRVDPPFASPTVDTPVTISAAAPPNLLSTPRAYLNPNPVVAGATATALSATVLLDNSTMTSVVPAGLTPGSYDLIVVNPDGQVGLITAGITVTSMEPPVIDTVTPQTFANNTDYTAVITGENFDAAGVTVSLDCDAGGVRMQYPATVQNVTTTTANVTFPTGALSKGTVCLVTITNTAEQTSFSFSAISITNSSFNLEPWSTDNPMTVARRALSLEAGRPTRTSRYLYAVGGDNGAPASALASVEGSSVDVFGGLGTWRLEPNALPAPRTLAGVDRIGRFLYLVGGSDGTSAVNTLLRAQVLDPLATPSIVDVDAALGDGVAGLGGGLWMYRIAATFAANDVNNPGGESLAGEVQNIDLPDVPGLIQLTIDWEPVPDATGYRIYRSPAADAGFDALALVAVIPDAATLTWTDDGAVADTTQRPLPSGATGTWHAMAPLNTARAALAAAAVPIPGSPGQWVLYAFGGRNAAGTAVNTVEYTTVTVAADGSQTVAAWTTAAATLSAAKAEAKAFRIDGADAAAVPAGANWLYVGPGRAGATFVTDLDAFEVTAALEPAFFSVNRTPSNRAGYCAGASNGYLYVFGGQGGGANAGGISAEMCDTVSAQCPNVPPDLRSGAWNSLGISMSDSRVYCDVAQESAFYFVAGGSNGTVALSSVDSTVQ